jgi:hypothetical protein
VILATASDSHFLVAPAGRPVVAVPAAQSNPYVEQGGREADQKRMLHALVTGDAATFTPLADRYGVSHVLLGPHDTHVLDAAAPPGLVRERSRRGGYALYERTGRSAARDSMSTARTRSTP